MTRASRKRLIAETIREMESRVSSDFVGFDTLAVDFEARTVTLRGRTVQCPPGATSLVFPIVDTTHVIVLRNSGDVL